MIIKYDDDFAKKLIYLSDFSPFSNKFLVQSHQNLAVINPTLGNSRKMCLEAVTGNKN